MARSRSDWKSHGSDMKRKSGSLSRQIENRSCDTRLNPSQFHTRLVKIVGWSDEVEATGLLKHATEEVSVLSDESSFLEKQDSQGYH